MFSTTKFAKKLNSVTDRDTYGGYSTVFFLAIWMASFLSFLPFYQFLLSSIFYVGLCRVCKRVLKGKCSWDC